MDLTAGTFSLGSVSGQKRVRILSFEALVFFRHFRLSPNHCRRSILCDLELRSPLHVIAELQGEKPWETACREGWEGVIPGEIRTRTSKQGR